MIKRLFDQVVEAFGTTDTAERSAEERDRALRMATAVLMIEVARADHDFSEDELERALKLIESHFELDPEDAAKLMNAANEKAEDLVSLHEFTQLLHRNLHEREKSRIVSLLWQIAYADGRLDKFEDALVLQIGDLLYVSRGLVMKLKHDADPRSS